MRRRPWRAAEEKEDTKIIVGESDIATRLNTIKNQMSTKENVVPTVS